MKSSAKNIQMTSYDELFNPGDANETVQEIALAELHDFPNHPFRVQEDDAMRELAESIRIYGVKFVFMKIFLNSVSSSLIM